MKLHYFNQDSADDSDWQLEMAIGQGYVPRTCLLSGPVVMSEINKGRDPCAGCASPRGKCNGRPRTAYDPLSI